MFKVCFIFKTDRQPAIFNAKNTITHKAIFVCNHMYTVRINNKTECTRDYFRVSFSVLPLSS
jgi:hypothetical protein